MKRRRLTDRTQSVCASYAGGKSLREVAELFGISKPYVRDIIRHHAPEILRHEVRVDFDEVRMRRLAEAGFSIRKIALEIGREMSATKRALKRYGIKTNALRGKKATVTESLDADRLQWKELQPWPDIHFDSLTFKPGVSRRPRIAESSSGCGNSMQMVEAA